MLLPFVELPTLFYKREWNRVEGEIWFFENKYKKIKF